MKFNTPPQELAVTMARLRDVTEHVTPNTSVNIITEDPSDNRILECAQVGRSEYLVTRDKHLLKLKNFGPTKILLAADFLEGFRAQGQRR